MMEIMTMPNYKFSQEYVDVSQIDWVCRYRYFEISSKNLKFVKKFELSRKVAKIRVSTEVVRRNVRCFLYL